MTTARDAAATVKSDSGDEAYDCNDMIDSADSADYYYNTFDGERAALSSLYVSGCVRAGQHGSDAVRSAVRRFGPNPYDEA